jgi:hypothetical protein
MACSSNDALLTSNVVGAAAARVRLLPELEHVRFEARATAFPGQIVGRRHVSIMRTGWSHFTLP